MELNVWTWIAGQLIIAAAIWGGIRMDIRGIHERVSKVEKSIDNAHQRMDRHLERREEPR